MESRTPETVERIDELIGKLRSAAQDLKDDVKWQPHMKHITQEFQSKLIDLERDFTRQFLRTLEKGWFY